MKPIILFSLSLMVISSMGCQQDVITNEIRVSPMNVSLSIGTTTVISGDVGYFSPELSPVGIPMELPPGLVMSNYSWLSDPPQCSYSMVYLKGKVGPIETMRRAHPDKPLNIWASGTWTAVTNSVGTRETCYLEISVDSLQIISMVNTTNRPSLVLNGDYSCIFSFTQDDSTQTGNVKFTFSDTSYTCLPEKLYLPPAGGGIYSLQNDTIIFTDMVAHTANFDWTLILNGKFSCSINNNLVVFFQEDTTLHRIRRIELMESN